MQNDKIIDRQPEEDYTEAPEIAADKADNSIDQDGQQEAEMEEGEDQVDFF